MTSIIYKLNAKLRRLRVFLTNFKLILVLSPAFMTYTYAMLIHPATESNLDWNYIQGVWYDWQGLNVGILALISSITLLYAAKHNEIKQSERELKCAKAFMPEALSELCDYLKLATALVKEAHDDITITKSNHHELTNKPPVLPEKYRGVMETCIKHGDNQTTQDLSSLIHKIQVLNSRLSHINKGFRLNSTTIFTSRTTLGLFMTTGEIQSILNKAFSYARSNTPILADELTLSDYVEAYNNLEHGLSDIEGLTKFTLEYLEKRMQAK